MEKKNIFGTFISVGTYQAFIDEIFSLVQSKKTAYACFANVHMIIEAYQDKSFQKVINEANLVAPDGKPLSLFLNLTEEIKQVRICGMDIFPDLLERAEATDRSVFFYGSTDELLNTISQKALIEFPSLKIAGCYAPPFRTLSKEEDETIVQRIKEAQPDLIFVSLGCPKQERWMADHKSKFNACLLGLGQAFKVYAGVETRLPKWMRNLSIEWLYRLCLEPRRLWKRYLYTNSYFLILVVRFLVIRFFQNTRLSNPAISNEDSI